MSKIQYPLMSAHERTVLTQFKRTYTRLLLEFYKARMNGQLPAAYGELVISVNTLERQLPPEIAFSARKQIDLVWDPSIREAYEATSKRAG